jgi:hypothetical protein
MGPGANFTCLFEGPILSKMAAFARTTLNHLLVPIVVLGTWAYAHFKNVTVRNVETVWREGGVWRVGNPYTTPVPNTLGMDASETDHAGSPDVDPPGTQNDGPTRDGR